MKWRHVVVLNKTVCYLYGGLFLFGSFWIPSTIVWSTSMHPFHRSLSFWLQYERAHQTLGSVSRSKKGRKESQTSQRPAGHSLRADDADDDESVLDLVRKESEHTARERALSFLFDLRNCRVRGWMITVIQSTHRPVFSALDVGWWSLVRGFNRGKCERVVPVLS